MRRSRAACGIARVDLTLVQAVPELVEAGEDAADVVREEARCQADVVVRDRDRERVDGVVEPPGLVVHPPRLEHVERERALAVDGVAPRGTSRRWLPELCDHLHEPVAQAIEDDLDFGGLHARLVIVEERVVRSSYGSWQATYSRVSSMSRSSCGRKTSKSLASAPGAHLVADRAGARHLRPKVGRDARCFS